MLAPAVYQLYSFSLNGDMAKQISDVAKVHRFLNRYNNFAKRGYCSVPEQLKVTSNCAESVISAHSISRRTLKSISNASHVLRFDLSRELPSKVLIKKIGINSVSTFQGFCPTHDKSIFSPLEDRSMKPDSEQVFLLTYRECCHEVFKKRNLLKVNSRYLKELVPPGAKVAIDIYLEQCKFGLRGVELVKERMDSMLLSQDFSEIRYLVFHLDQNSPYLCSAFFNPEISVKGIQLQDIHDYSIHQELMSFNVWNSDDKAVIILAWLSGHYKSRAFAQDLFKLKRKEMPNQLMNMAFEYSENICFLEPWWEGLTERNKNLLRKRVKSGTGPDYRNYGNVCFDGQSGAKFRITGVSGNMLP